MKNNLGNSKVCKTLIKHGEIKVNNQIIKDVKYSVNPDDIIIYQQRQLVAQPFVYYMMNKPANYICANKDKHYPCVIDLVGRQDCYCLGRLDIDTTGLLIITNDPMLSKKLLLPQNHVEKKYYVTTALPLKDELVAIFYKGVVIDQNIRCQSSQLEIIDEYHCMVTIKEGKYHQIKKMFLSCSNQVVALKRVAFANLELDQNLALGEYRALNLAEIESLLK